MRRLCHYGDAPGGTAGAVGLGRTAGDLALIAALLAAAVAISAHAPSDLYAYAQLNRVGTAISMLQKGDWLLPHDQMGSLASKPQLYPWMAAAAMALTGLYDDFVFCLPTILAALATAAGVYVLGRRWYGRRAGLLAAALWVAGLDVTRMVYLASTDMLLAMSVIASLACADRLVFHRASGPARRWWAAGLWATMILGALAKGWGLVNFALVGGTVALAAGLGPGFRPLRVVRGAAAKAALALRLVGRRWRRAAKATYLPWGLLATAAVLVPMWVAMVLHGGQEFRRLIYFEFYQRITGAGEHAPKGASVPPLAFLIYNTLPSSAFAIGALVLARTSGWRRGPLCLPLCWIAAVVLPFSLAHGFRPDYLLPCYAAVALMAAWAVEEILRRRERRCRDAAVLRHVFAGTVIVLAVALAVVAGAYGFAEHLPQAMQDLLRRPAVLGGGTQWVLAGLLPGAGLGVAAMAVFWSLRWRLRRMVALTVVLGLGAAFVNTHAISRHARTGDGETMRRFSHGIRPIVGPDGVVVYRVAKLGVEVYLGRLGVEANNIDDINASRPPWLVTCDRGLAELGACQVDANGPYEIRTARGKVRLRPRPEELGELLAASEAIESQNWGRILLIRLRRPARALGKPVLSVWESGRRDDW